MLVYSGMPRIDVFNEPPDVVQLNFMYGFEITSETLSQRTIAIDGPGQARTPGAGPSRGPGADWLQMLSQDPGGA